MRTQTDTIHDDIVSALNIKIDEALDSFDGIIAEKRKDCESGNVPNSGFVYESFIRNIREKALSQLNGVKTWLGTHVLSTIIQQVRTSGVYKLHELKEDITAAEAEKQKALEEKQRILENDYALSDFEKYSLFGHPEFEPSRKRNVGKKRTQDTFVPTKAVNPNVELVYRKYIWKRKRGIVIGLIVTAICAAIDYGMIYTLFLSANYTDIMAMMIAIISAAMLDAPPYVFGYIWTKSDDDRSLLELQGNTNTSEGKRKTKGNKILLIIMSVVILIAFLVYLAVRILSFLGGGDFNLAFHAIFEWNWSEVKNVDFSGADFFSTIVPIATSVVALAVGRTLYAMKTDYIKESIIAINNEINDRIRVCEEKIVDCEKQIKDLGDIVITLKKEIWTFYSGRKPFPADDESFRTEVSLVFQKMNLSLYKQTYSDCCLLLRNQALSLLRTVNDQMAQYAADQTKIITMELSENEKECLDDFWVVSTMGTSQHPITQSHLNSIENVVKEILNNLK